MAADFVPFPHSALDGSIVDRFSEQVRQYPDRLALRDRAQTLTYRELGLAVDRIAQRILHHRGPASEPVGIVLKQTTWFVQAALGALAAGKYYVPLDPSHPPARLRAMVRHAAAALILTDREHIALARDLIDDPDQLVDSVDAATAGATSSAPGSRPAVLPDALAYVYYTSGSTGEPKGVMDTHRNVLHNVMRYTNTLRIRPEDRLTHLQSPGNSGAVSDIFGALLVGAGLLTFDLREDDLTGLAAWIQRERPTVYHSAPAIFRYAAKSPGDFSSLRVIRLEGDQATRADLDVYRSRCAPDCMLVNGLGLTECGLIRQYFVDPTTPVASVVPVGYPVEDMTVLVLDPAGDPAATGAIGEIVVESAYLALGYVGRPDLTAASFSQDPLRPGIRRYRTGDLGRMGADGCLEHLGRTDFQPKIRGHRIDLAEIETALLSCPAVREAIVIVDDRGRDEPRLVAYCVPAGMPLPTGSALRRHLAERVPLDLLPASYVWLDRWPLSENGKVDRRALPAPGRARPSLDTAFAAPRTRREADLVQLWADVLALDEIGVDDDFFDLGGDSLQGARLVAMIRDQFSVELAVRVLFEHPSPASLATAIDALATVSPDATAPAILPRSAPTGRGPARSSS
ncbi:MAG: non-ribosomal peptide synthetase [Casimicrobiaceae bacterium]